MNPRDRLVQAMMGGRGDVPPVDAYGRRSYGKGSVQTDEPPPTRDDALVDLENELRLRWFADQGRGAVAGVANPFGLTSMGAQGLSYVAPWLLSPDTASGFGDTLNRWDTNAPMAASMSTFLLPGYGLARLAGASHHILRPLGATGGLVGMRGAVLRDRKLTDEERAREYGAAGY